MSKQLPSFCESYKTNVLEWLCPSSCKNEANWANQNVFFIVRLSTPEHNHMIRARPCERTNRIESDATAVGCIF